MTKTLIWKTKPNIATAKKKVGPTAPKAEKISKAGCANSLKLTTQLKFGSENVHNHRIKVSLGKEKLDINNHNPFTGSNPVVNIKFIYLQSEISQFLVLLPVEVGFGT